VQFEPLQYPQTPKSTPLKEASGIPLITGVDSVERSSRTKAVKKRTAKGVAGRNIATVVWSSSRENESLSADRSSRHGGVQRRVKSLCKLRQEPFYRGRTARRTAKWPTL
jgi:hypothetical protein